MSRRHKKHKARKHHVDKWDRNYEVSTEEEFQPRKKVAPLEPQNQMQAEYMHFISSRPYTIATGYAGTGKALALDEPVLTPHGWKVMGSMRVGDTVTTPDGKEEKVTGYYPQGVVEMYEVETCDGVIVKACKDHLWHAKTNKQPLSQMKTWRTEDMAKELEMHRTNSFTIPLVSQLDRKSEEVMVFDPYLLGVLIGDGHLGSRTSRLSTSDLEIVEAFEKEGFPTQNLKGYDYTIYGATPFINQLGLSGKLSYDKFVPEDYLKSTYKTRLALLQGLMDSDGCAEGSDMNGVSFSSASHQLAKDVQYLVRSVGGTAKLSKKATSSRFGKAYLLYIRHPDPDSLFRLSRKKISKANPSMTNRIVRITPCEPCEAACISISGDDKLYVTRDFVVTHNTYIPTRMACQYLKAKDISKIVLARPAVSASKSLGFFKGTKEEKMKQWLMPIWSTLLEEFSEAKLETMIKYGELEFVPLETIKGNSWKDAFIIIDEAEDCVIPEIKSILTRIGTNSTMVLCGDVTQTDLKNSGLAAFLKLREKSERLKRVVEYVSFDDHDDIVRSEACKEVILGFEEVESNE